MAIEFTCTACQNLVRTSDSTAGKKGRCPFCKAVMQIPKVSEAPAGDPLPSVATPLPPADDAITFTCQQCGKSNRAPSNLAGKKGRCAGCKAVVQIPGGPAKAPSKPALQPVSPGRRARKPVLTDEDLGFAPADSDSLTTAEPALAPLSSAASSGLSPLNPVSSGLTPLNPTAGLQPLSTPGLSPLGAPGLSPLGMPGLSPLQPAGLAPLGSPGLTPLGGPVAPAAPDPYALAPLGGSGGLSPLGSAGSSPFGAAAPSSPYASPSMPAGNWSQPQPAAYDVDDSQRRGLPWEKDNDSDEFSSTVKMVIFEPGNAFLRMHTTGGLGRAFFFNVAGNLVGFLANILYAYLITLLMLLTGAGAAGDAEVAAKGFAVMTIGFVLYALAVTVAIIPSTMLGAVIGAGILHLMLLIVNGARRGYETTLKTVCYCYGAVGATNAVPCANMVMIFLAPVVLIIAIARSHGISTGKAAFAVLLPFIAFGLLFLAFCGLNILGMIVNIMQAAGG